MSSAVANSCDDSDDDDDDDEAADCQKHYRCNLQSTFKCTVSMYGLRPGTVATHFKLV